MEFKIWQIWLMAGVFFWILEIFIPSFVVANFGVGCLLAAIGAAFDLSLSWQFLIFSLGTIISFFTVRPLMIKYAYQSGQQVSTNFAAVVGQQAKVHETINSKEGTGRVLIDGDSWKAISETNEIIEEGELVEVTAINSIILSVKPIKQ